ncbi:MAG: hypothetical protein RR338_00600 [Clostridia bacterium]
MTIYATINSQGQFQLATEHHNNVYTFNDCKNFEDIFKINNITNIDFYKKMMSGVHTFSMNDYN